ncbi:DMT family transporter [Rhodobacteraceae bacterium NNCM2]|nr:DMT family transporter [Coraliihabitans acroporae]
MAMTSTSVPPASLRGVEGIICILVGMVLFVGQDVLMKQLLGTYPVWMLIFTRSVVTLVMLTPLIWLLGPPHRLITPLWPWHLARAVLFATGFSMFYAAFPFMGLAEVTTLFFSAPLITATLAALFLGEQIGLHRMGALLVGFVGVVIAMNPAGDTFSWVAVLPILCAITYSLSQIIVRKIGDQESTLTIGLYTIGFSGLLIGPMGWMLNQVIEIGPDMAHLRADWPVPTLDGLWPLALLGVIGMVAYMLVSRAYQVANASLVAPFDYSYLPFATVIAYLMWGEVPGWSTVTGMGLIVASGVYIGYRELRAVRDPGQIPPTAEATFAPGNPMTDLGQEVTAGDEASRI